MLKLLLTMTGLGFTRGLDRILDNALEVPPQDRVNDAWALFWGALREVISITCRVEGKGRMNDVGRHVDSRAPTTSPKTSSKREDERMFEERQTLQAVHRLQTLATEENPQGPTRSLAWRLSRMWFVESLIYRGGSLIGLS